MHVHSSAFRRQLCIAMSILFLATASAYAGDVAFDIPPQDLGSSLNQLARQSNMQILFAADLVEGKRAPALKGSYAPEAALRALLAGSGLETTASRDGTFAVRSAQLRHLPESREDHRLDDVVITATRTARRVDEVPASVSVLTTKDLATKNRQNVFEALRDAEGLDFLASPGIAHQDVPTIRGVGKTTAGSTTQVLVDGMATDSIVSAVPGRGGLNFTSLQDVERVEVVRGPASALYGPSAVGGVINVIPKRWIGAPGVEANASYGTHDTQTYGVAAGMAKEAFDIRLSAYDAKSDGFKSQPVAAPEATNGSDLAGRDWKDNKIGFLAGFRPADNHELTAGFRQYATRSAGNFGGRPNDRHDLDGKSATLGYRYDLSSDTNVKIDYRSTELKQRYTFDKWDWNGMANNLALAYYGGRDSDSTAFQAIVDTRPVSGNQLIVGFGHDKGDFKQFGTTVGGSTTTTTSKSEVNALFFQDEHRIGAFVLTVGARHDRIVLSPDMKNGAPTNGKGSVANVVNPRAGVRYHLDEITSFYAAAGTAYVPALNSLKFVQPSATRVDNPDLKPEKSTTHEIGMNNRWSSGSLRTAIYHTDYEDKISLGIDSATGKQQYQNIAVVEVDGFEMAYQGNFGRGWLPYANYAVTKARDFATKGAPGKQSLRVAPHKFNAGLTYAPGDVWSATLNVRYVSGLYFGSITQAQWADEYKQLDAKFSARLPVHGQKWEAFLAVNNLTDKIYEPYNKNEWSDGRTVTVGLSGKF